MSVNKPVGGYFELSGTTKLNESFHDDLYAVNSGRNALRLLIESKEIKELYVPYYTCKVILEILKISRISVKWYHVNEQLEIVEKIPNSAYLIYTNYFGIKDKYIDGLSINYKNLIIDNAQAFFSKPINGVDTFYSPRKFFGLPDGGFLYTDHNINLDVYPKDQSFDRCGHLLKRIDLSAEEGYEDFKLNDEKLDGQPIKQISNLTHYLLKQIDYNEVKKVRSENFKHYYHSLRNINCLDINIGDKSIPMVYPLLFDEVSAAIALKKKLIESKIYVATYWPELIGQKRVNDLPNKIIALPLDQRYTAHEIRRVLEIINI